MKNDIKHFLIIMLALFVFIYSFVMLLLFSINSPMNLNEEILNPESFIGYLKKIPLLISYELKYSTENIPCYVLYLSLENIDDKIIVIKSNTLRGIKEKISVLF